MSEISSDLKSILNKHREDIEKLKKEVNTLTSNNKKILEKYQFLLEKLLEINGTRKLAGLQAVSTTKNQPIANTTNPLFRMGDFQILILLHKGRAITPTFAVSSMQLKAAFSIDKSERTIRNKLTELEYNGHISSIGQRPKRYFLTNKGMDLIEKQQKDALNFNFYE